jgi:hypothetical protein
VRGFELLLERFGAFGMSLLVRNALLFADVAFHAGKVGSSKVKDKIPPSSRLETIEATVSSAACVAFMRSPRRKCERKKGKKTPSPENIFCFLREKTEKSRNSQREDSRANKGGALCVRERSLSAFYCLVVLFVVFSNIGFLFFGRFLLFQFGAVV